MRSSFIWDRRGKINKKHSIFYWGISFLIYVNSFLVCTSDMILTLCTMILMGVSHKQVKSPDWRCDLYNPFHHVTLPQEKREFLELEKTAFFGIDLFKEVFSEKSVFSGRSLSQQILFEKFVPHQILAFRLAIIL
jgi:hypothetical protein